MTARYAYLGPQGTFTEAALLTMPSSQGAEIFPAESVRVALDLVRDGSVTGALVPIENSVEGSVSATVDELAHGEPLQIVDEVAIPVTFALLALPGTSLTQVERIATHPHAHAQCLGWLHNNMPGVHVLPSMSTAAAAAELAAGAHYDAAICSKAAAAHYGLEVLAEGIGDTDAAWTRFVLVRKPGHTQQATGHDKTTLNLFMRANRPGALLEILTEFSARGIDLTRIESRPTKKALGDYFFSLDLEGHIDDEAVGTALKELREICAEVKFLGSYPRHEGPDTSSVEEEVRSSSIDSDQWLNQLRQRNN